MADGRVYGQTATRAFALNAATGKPVWVDSDLLASGQGTFEIQPQAAGGRVYLATAYGSGPGGGVLMALNAATGKLLWKFSTLTGPAPGVRALGLGAGGAWETPLAGGDGTVTPVGEHNGHDDDSLLLLEHKITLKPPYVIAMVAYTVP